MKAASLQQQQSPLRFAWMVSKGEEVFYRLLIVPLIAFLPASLAYGLACLRGDWRYRLDEGKRRQILSNLEGVFGEQLSAPERQAVARDFFRRISCQPIDVIRLAGKGRALGRLVEIRGLEHLQAALATGKGAVICITHFGSVVSCCSLLGAYGFPVTAVGNLNSHPVISLFERLLRRLKLASAQPRHLHRPNIEPQQGAVEAAVRMAEILRGNEVLVISIDVPVSPQDRPHALPVEFLGRQVLLLPGGVSIAQHTGSCLLVAVAHRGWPWHRQVLELSPVPLEGDIQTTFERCVALLQAPIRQHPALWDGWLNARDLVDLGLLPTDAQ